MKMPNPGILWATTGGATAAAVIRLEPVLLEEGFLVHVAQRLANGEQLYRDVLFFTGPLPFEFLALLFRILGEHLFVARGVMVALAALGTGTTFAIARRAGSGPIAHAAAALVASAPILGFPFYTFYFYTPITYHLAILAVYAALRGQTSGRWAFGCGVLIAASALCKQNLGVFLALGLFATTLLTAPREQRKAIARAIAAGGAATALATLALFALRGTLGDFVNAVAVLPFALGESFRAPFPNLWPPGVLDKAFNDNAAVYLPNLYFLRVGFWVGISSAMIAVTQFLYGLPFLVVGLTFLRRLGGKLPPAVWIHGALLAAMIGNLFPRSDWGHAVYAIPAAGVQLLLISSFRRTPREGLPGAPHAIAGFLVVGLAALCADVGTFLHRSSIPPILGPKVPLWAVSPTYQTPAVQRVIRFIRNNTEPGDPIFVARQEPLIYFATETSNPTPFEGVIAGLHEMQERIILEALPRVKYVVLSDIDQPQYHYYGDELPGVLDHLERYFRIPIGFQIDQFAWMLVLEHGKDRGATHLDFVREQQRGERFIRGRNATVQPPRMPAPRLQARLLGRPLSVRLGPRGGGIDFQIEVPDNAEFQAGVGIRTMGSVDDFHEHPPETPAVFSILQDGETRLLRRVPISDAPNQGGRWRRVRIDLAEFAGEAVTLRMEFDPAKPIQAGTLAWFGSPRIAIIE